ncbi:hypothetical protein [Sphingomonas daechungensis]|uniref:hypothetical protein n=1 Tax=Sphingomonas daechungensis TaxID=1176646 RepID=UPI0037DA2C7F
MDPNQILKVAAALPNTIVVADEAYLDFSTTPSLAGMPPGVRTSSFSRPCPRLTVSLAREWVAQSASLT